MEPLLSAPGKPPVLPMAVASASWRRLFIIRIITQYSSLYKAYMCRFIVNISTYIQKGS